MDKLSLRDPLVATNVVAATLMILKAVGMSWMTAVRMMQVKGGYRSPENLRKTPLNPKPDAKRPERVERIRRERTTCAFPCGRSGRDAVAGDGVNGELKREPRRGGGAWHAAHDGRVARRGPWPILLPRSILL